ncbi:MAG: sigma-54-dependent Fis family transcriptional regulator [Kiritimatiellae bacterium]|nr:sigma-54-dependent Fis family transcriptional regulator [Kiritimatiellia bacterium]
MIELQILVVEDNELQRKTLYGQLSGWGHQVFACESLAEARALSEEHAFDLVLLDMKLPDGDGLDYLEEQKAERPDVHTVIMTAYADVPTAVAALKKGAYDYLPKPFDGEHLGKIVRHLEENAELSQRIHSLTRLTTDAADDVWRLGDMIVKTESMRQIFEKAQRVAESGDTTVLILGESGTGKGLLAKAIHRLSPRAAKPFVDINCSAIPEQLMESEIFGYEKGAFTDAKNRKIGLLEAADGGTVFLDEIGDMGLNLQGKVLKVIEEKEFRRLGSARTTRVNIRVIAATNRNLEERIQEGKFREDLFYRLSVVPITLPPLRDRRDCIMPLCRHYLKIFSKKIGRSASDFAPDASTLLERYSWPGNIRELCNVVERSVILCTGDTISVDDLGLPGAPAAAGAPAQQAAWVPMSLADGEKKLITSVLDSVNGNRSKAADILKIHRTTLYKKIAEYGLEQSEV